MAFDGFCIGRIVKEYKELLVEGKISKIIEPAAHEVILVIKNAKGSFNILCSANPAIPYTFVVEEKPEAPVQAPIFCMVLRKYLLNGKILDVYQTGNERIITFDIEHMNEMGDKSVKKLILELMGKYSNVIITDEEGTIIDSIKHVNALTSSLREVGPNKKYFVPIEITKINPYKDSIICEEYLNDNLRKILSDEKMLNSNVVNVIAKEFEGVSKVTAREIVARAGLLLTVSCKDLKEEDYESLTKGFVSFLKDNDSSTSITLYKDLEGYVEYTNTPYVTLNEFEAVNEDRMMFALSKFYKSKQVRTTNNQKAGELARFVKNILDKDKNKITLWENDLKECENKEELKINGELLKAYAYCLEKGNEAKVLNYYNNEEVVIPLDDRLTIIENSNKYFKLYNKAKRCESAVTELMANTNKEIDYLEEILLFLSLAETSSDIDEIKSELSQKGFLRKKNIKLLKKSKPKIKHYVFMDNYHIYVGKNNVQNEEISFKKAVGNDWWFHAKGIPGSHVIVKSDKDNPASEWDMPSEVFDLAGAIAALNSKHSDMTKVEIDYTRKKHLKKPADGNMGMVIYHTNYSMVATPDISRFELTTIS